MLSGEYSDVVITYKHDKDINYILVEDGKDD